MILGVKVVPKSSRNQVVGWLGPALKICVTHPPEKGKANEAMVKVLANLLEIPKEQIRLIRGETSPRKVVEILKVEESEFHQRVEAHLGKKPV